MTPASVLRQATLLAGVAFSVTLPIVFAAPAFAYYPTNCIEWVYGDDWSSNCYAGYGYDTASNYVAGVQGIVTVEGYDAGGRDGYWGSNTEGAVESWQSAHGLTNDGIIGDTESWPQLRSDIAYIRTIDNYYSYEVSDNSDIEDDFYQYNVSGPYYLAWYIVPNSCCGTIPFTDNQLSV